MLKPSKINGDNLYTYMEAIENGAIEKGIRETCDLLYQLGAVPLSSCEGHPPTENKDDYCAGPFVMFYCSEHTLKQINDALIKFDLNWMLRGRFHQSLECAVWKLTPEHPYYIKREFSYVELKKDIKQVEQALNHAISC